MALTPEEIQKSATNIVNAAHAVSNPKATQPF